MRAEDSPPAQCRATSDTRLTTGLPCSSNIRSARPPIRFDAPERGVHAASTAFRPSPCRGGGGRRPGGSEMFFGDHLPRCSSRLDLRVLGAVEGPVHLPQVLRSAGEQPPHRARDRARHHESPAESPTSRWNRCGGGAERPLRSRARRCDFRVELSGRARSPSIAVAAHAGRPRAAARRGLRAAPDPERRRSGGGLGSMLAFPLFFIRFIFRIPGRVCPCSWIWAYCSSPAPCCSGEFAALPVGFDASKRALTAQLTSTGLVRARRGVAAGQTGLLGNAPGARPTRGAAAAWRSAAVRLLRLVLLRNSRNLMRPAPRFCRGRRRSPERVAARTWIARLVRPRSAVLGARNARPAPAGGFPSRPLVSPPARALGRPAPRRRGVG